MSKFHKNAIITGCIDSYCLVCENHLRSEEDVSSHIEKPVHKKNLDSSQYLENYKNDCIRKVKKGYFCEFCNLLFSMVAKAVLHIFDAKHITNRGVQLLRRVGNSVISSSNIDNVFINENAWNGIIDNTCAICNTEFYDKNIHKTEQKHVLNLVQKEVVFDAKGNIYRKIDDSSYQCLICNMIFAMTTVTTHFVSDDHKNCLVKCREFQQTSQSSDIKYSNDDSFKETTQTANSREINLATWNKKQVKSATKSTSRKIKLQNYNHKQNLTKKSTDESGISKDNVQYEIRACGGVTLKTGSEGDKHLENEKAIEPEKDILTKDNTPQAQHLLNYVRENTTKSDKVDATTQLNDETTSKKLTPKKLGTNNVKTENIKGDNKEKELNKQSDIQKILDNVSDFQKKGININFETETAACKKCVFNLDFDSEAIEKHIEDHKNKPNNHTTAHSTSAVDPNFCRTIVKNDNVKQHKIPNELKDQPNKIDENHNIKKDYCKKPNTELNSENNTDKPLEQTAIPNGPAHKLNEDHSNKVLVTYLPSNANNQTTNDETSNPSTKKENKDSNIATDDDPISFAKANKLTYNKGNNTAFCRLCDSRIPSSFRSMKEHVAGAAHKIRASKAVNTKANIPKKSMKKFIKSSYSIENMYQDDVVINYKYCLTKFSFLMITEHGNRLRCQVCEMNLMKDDVDDHVESVTHNMALEVTPVVWNLDTEFIREVRSGLFHCGFCNLIMGCWEDVSKHLACAEHRNERCAASRRLQAHLPGLQRHRQRESQLVDMFMLRHFGLGTLF